MTHRVQGAHRKGRSIKIMDPKLAEAIGLLRHQIISPVLMDTSSAQLAYFRLMSEREFDVPGKGARRFTPTTMKAWLYRYRKNGFAGITPKVRKDQGGFRVISNAMKEKIKQLRQESLEQSCVKFYDRCLREEALGEPPMCMETLRRGRVPELVEIVWKSSRVSVT
jgi:hypothetical protein